MTGKDQLPERRVTANDSGGSPEWEEDHHSHISHTKETFLQTTLPFSYTEHSLHLGETDCKGWGMGVQLND